MNTVRSVFAIICIVFLTIFYVGTIGYSLDSGNIPPWWLWIFIVAPPLYGLVELFAYIVRIGGRDE